MTDPGPAQSSGYKTGGGSALYILIICMLLYAINYIDKQVFSIVLQPMKLELGLTDSQCGLAQTIFIMGTAILAFPISYLIDRWSRSKTIGIMALLWSIFTAGNGFARNFTTLIIPRSLVGVGEAGFSAGGVALVSASYTQDKRARMLGILNMGAPLGAAIGMIAGGIISVSMGWRWAFYIFAIPGIILGILAFFMHDYKTPSRSGAAGGMRNFGKTVLDLFRTRSLCLYFFGEGILCFMTVSVLAWAPALLMRVMNMSEATAGIIVGGWGLMAIIAAPLGGWLADLWQKKTGRGRLHMPALTAVLASIVLIIMVGMRFGPVGIGLGFLYGILTVISIPALNAFTQDVVPAANKGLAVGLATFCAYVFGGAWGPTFVGSVSDAVGGGADGLTYAVLLTSIGGFIGGILLWLAARTYPADMSKIKAETMIT